MRFGLHFAVVTTAAALLVTSTDQANAQTFFQKLFGLNKPSETRAKPAPRRVNPPRGSARGYGMPGGFQDRRTPRYQNTNRGGQYRTMCVRMCDGYYFPISSSASRSRFRRDARACRSRCGEDAKLFYHRRTDRSVDGMVDLSGRMYAKLDIAYRYRERLIDGCSCRPDPWSDAERARHAAYAGPQNSGQEGADRPQKLAAASDGRVTEITEAGATTTATTAALPSELAPPRPKAVSRASRAGQKSAKRRSAKRKYARKRTKRKKPVENLPWLKNGASTYRFPGD